MFLLYWEVYVLMELAINLQNDLQNRFTLVKWEKDSY